MYEKKVVSGFFFHWNEGEIYDMLLCICQSLPRLDVSIVRNYMLVHETDRMSKIRWNINGWVRKIIHTQVTLRLSLVHLWLEMEIYCRFHRTSNENDFFLRLKSYISLTKADSWELGFIYIIRIRHGRANIWTRGKLLRKVYARFVVSVSWLMISTICYKPFFRIKIQ